MAKDKKRVSVKKDAENKKKSGKNKNNQKKNKPDKKKKVGKNTQKSQKDRNKVTIQSEPAQVEEKLDTADEPAIPGVPPAEASSSPPPAGARQPDRHWMFTGFWPRAALVAAVLMATLVYLNRPVDQLPNEANQNKSGKKQAAESDLPEQQHVTESRINRQASEVATAVSTDSEVFDEPGQELRFESVVNENDNLLASPAPGNETNEPPRYRPDEPLEQTTSTTEIHTPTNEPDLKELPYAFPYRYPPGAYGYPTRGYSYPYPPYPYASTYRR